MDEKELLGYIGIAVGVVAIGLFMYRKEILFLFKKKEVKGTIVNWMSYTEKGKKYFYPMIEFNSLETGKLTFRADERCEDKPLYRIGTEVKIHYLSGDADHRKVTYP